jgi:hypothetical protein
MAEQLAEVGFGLALSVASTVVLVRVLVDNGALQSRTGRIAIGWLVMEDILHHFRSGVDPCDFRHGWQPADFMGYCRRSPKRARGNCLH